jgi:hypothetical protein
MSKLLEKLERISEGSGQPLGFGAAANRTKKSPMVIVASMPVGNAELAIIAVESGADAVLMTAEHRKKDEVFAQLRSARMDIPWGVFLDMATRRETEQLIEIGCDFVVLNPAKTPAAVLNEERIGKVLQIDPSLSDNLARSINRLSIDAVLLSTLGRTEAHITIQDLMAYERLAAAAGKHLLAAIPPALPIDDVESLWSLGVRGLVVDMTTKNPELRLSQIKEAIQKLPARKKRGDRISATLPLFREGTEASPPEEEDDY